VFSGTHLTDDSLLAAMEVPLARLTGAGFDLPAAVRGWTTLYSYVIGFAIEEQAVRPAPGESDQRYAPERRAARIDETRYPLAAAAGPEIFSRWDERFEHGAGLILDGLERALERR
jgi:hypothetical protein